MVLVIVAVLITVFAAILGAGVGMWIEHLLTVRRARKLMKQGELHKDDWQPEHGAY